MIIIKKKLLSDIEELANILDILGKTNRAKAFYKTHAVLKKMKENKEKLPDNKKDLMKIKTIGKSISEIILDFEKTKKIEGLEELKRDNVVEVIMDLTKIHGFGVKQAEKLYKRGIKNISDLREAWVNGKIKLTSAQKLGVRYFEDMQTKIPHEEIKRVDLMLEKNVKKISDINKYFILGSYRRKKKLSGDIDILLVSEKSSALKSLIDLLKEKYTFMGKIASGTKKFMGLFLIESKVRQIDIILTGKLMYPTKLQYFTGSKEYNVKIRNIALKKGYKLSDEGLFKGGKRIKLKNEEHIFKILDLPYLKPEDR